MGRKYDCIYCDYDGTLTDDRQRHYKCYCDIVAKYGGICIPIQEYWADKRNKAKRTVLLEKTCFQGSYQDYLSEWLERIESPSYLEYEVLRQGVKDDLVRLKKHTARLVLISMRRNKSALVMQLEKDGLLGLFDEVIVGNPQSTDKKDLVEGNQESRYLVIGDTETDMELAMQLGCPAVAVTSGLREAKYLKADFYAEDFKDIMGYLKI